MLNITDVVVDWLEEISVAQVRFSPVPVVLQRRPAKGAEKLKATLRSDDEI